MSDDIQSQIDRARELLAELEKSINNDLTKKDPSDKTKNLVPEILVKIRNIFDQLMNQFFENEIMPNLIKEKTRKPNVYFPILDSKEILFNQFRKMKLGDLEETHKKVFSFIESVQPYHSKYSWLKDFKKFANERHVRLTPQKKFEEKRQIIESKSGRIDYGNGVIFDTTVADISLLGKKLPGGHRIDVNSDLISNDPEIKTRKEIWVSFFLGGTQVNALSLCKTAVNEGEQIIKKFQKLIK